MEGFYHYLLLPACWNVLIEVGITAGVDPDKPGQVHKMDNKSVM